MEPSQLLCYFLGVQTCSCFQKIISPLLFLAMPFNALQCFSMQCSRHAPTNNITTLT
jgi:hypothetical protein